MRSADTSSMALVAKQEALAVVRKGERYRNKRLLKVIAMTAWAAPCTGGNDAMRSHRAEREA